MPWVFVLIISQPLHMSRTACASSKENAQLSLGVSEHRLVVVPTTEIELSSYQTLAAAQ
jgi:hypothetical protein